MTTTPAAEKPPLPRDWGFFGPESVAWKVWIYPTSVLIGFARAVSVEFLDPHLTAAVLQTDQVMARTRLRFDRTMQYFASVLFDDAETVLKNSDMLVKIHARSYGHDPVTGRRFEANAPESQLWIHMTAWHSILKTYEAFGPGKLTEAEELRYWEECARAAEFQTIDPATVPRSRDAVRRYFAEWRKRNVAGEGAQAHYRYLVNGLLHIFPEEVPQPVVQAANAFVSRAVLSTLPGWANALGGVPYGLQDALFMNTLGTPLLKAALHLIHSSPPAEMALLDLLAPLTHPILEPVIFKRGVVEDKVWGVKEAREHFGYTLTPPEQFAAYQEAHARGEGPPPYTPRHHDPLLAFTE